MTAGLLALLLITAAQQPPPCRVAATEVATTTRAPNLTAESTTSCAFDRAGVKWSCTSKYKDSLGNSTTTVSVMTYKSVADIVDEVAAIPPLRRPMRVDASVNGSRGASKSNVVYTYDAQNRVAKEVATSLTTGSVATTSYTSWDAQGRPTAGTVVTTVGPGGAMTLKYDDATRKMTTATENMGQRVSCELTFDANGNSIGSKCGGPAGPGSQTTTTVVKTEKICR